MAHRSFPGRAVSTLALALALPAAAPAQGVFISPPPSVTERGAALTGQRAHVASELRFLGFRGVDVARLSSSQVARIDLAVHAGRSQGETRARVNAILRGGGLLQRGLDRLSR